MSGSIGCDLTEVFCGMQHPIAGMLKTGAGSIINRASILGTVGFAGSLASTAAKHGVIGLTEVAALEYRASLPT